MEVFDGIKVCLLLPQKAKLAFYGNKKRIVKLA